MKESQKEMRKEMFDQMEADLQKTCKPEDRMFALHPDEEHIIVSHALFLIMSKPLAGKKDTYYYLNDFKKILEETFNLEPKDMTRWETIKSDFLTVVENIIYE